MEVSDNQLDKQIHKQEDDDEFGIGKVSASDTEDKFSYNFDYLSSPRVNSFDDKYKQDFWKWFYSNPFEEDLPAVQLKKNFFSLDTQMTEEEIETMLFCKTKKPGDQDQPSKKKQIEIGIFKKIINRFNHKGSRRFRARLATILGIPETDEVFQTLKVMKAPYSDQKKKYYEKGTLEFILQKA